MLFADSPPSTMTSDNSTPWTVAIARIFASCASSETPRSASFSVVTIPSCLFFLYMATIISSWVSALGLYPKKRAK
jgi:hypothetical protein